MANQNSRSYPKGLREIRYPSDDIIHRFTSKDYTGDIRLNNETGLFEFNPPIENTESSTGISETITLKNHGFSLFDTLYHDGSEYKLGDASTLETCPLWVVVEVVDANNLEIAQAGRFKLNNTLTPGTTYYAFDEPGRISDTAPYDKYSKPIIFCQSNEIVHILPHRPIKTNLTDGTNQTAKKRIYISSTATGNNDGTSWGNAYTDINDAFSKLTSNSLVLIEGEEFVLTNGLNMNSLTNVEIVGGNSGNSTTLSNTHTILSGDINGDGSNLAKSCLYLIYSSDITITNLEVKYFRDTSADLIGDICIYGCHNFNINNLKRHHCDSYYGAIIASCSKFSIDGYYGNNNDHNPLYSDLFISQSNDVILDNMYLEDSTVGQFGAIAIQTSDVRISDSSFKNLGDNATTSGIIYVYGNSSLYVNRCSFTEMKHKWGILCASTGSNIEVYNSLLVDDPSVWDFDDSGIFYYNTTDPSDSGDMTAINCTMVSNFTTFNSRASATPQSFTAKANNCIIVSPQIREHANGGIIEVNDSIMDATWTGTGSGNTTVTDFDFVGANDYRITSNSIAVDYVTTTPEINQNLMSLFGSHYDLKGDFRFGGDIGNYKDKVSAGCYQVPVLTSTGGATIGEDITAIGIGNDMGIEDGDTVLTGTTVTDFVKQLLIKSVPPTYTSPSVTLGVSPSSTQEIGATISYVLTPNYTQGDGGATNNVDFFRSDILLHNQATTASYPDSNRVVEAGNIKYTVEVSYDQGPIKNDNLGNPYPTGRITAGTCADDTYVLGSYRNWSGSSNVVPTTSTTVRALPYSYSNSFTYESGSTNTVMVIAIPSTKNLVSVIDVDALNANITSNFTLAALNTVNDGGGNPVSYKVYILELASPYSTSHTHNVIIS